MVPTDKPAVELEAVDMTNPEPYVNPDAKKVLSKEALAKIARPVKGKRTGKKVAGHNRPPVFKAPPKGQLFGPIRKGPAQYVVCSTCSRLFSTPEKPVRMAIRARHAAKHLADHRMGRIRRPTEAKS